MTILQLPEHHCIGYLPRSGGLSATIEDPAGGQQHANSGGMRAASHGLGS